MLVKAWARSPACIRATAGTQILWPGSYALCRSLAFHRLLHNCKRPADFVFQFRKISAQNYFLRIEHDLDRSLNLWQMQSNRLPQPALHAIALDCSAQRLADGKSNAKTAAILSRQIENREPAGEVTAPPFVYALKIAVPQQPRLTGKLEAAPRRRTSARFPGFTARILRHSCLRNSR